GGLERETACVEGDRLADEAEDEVVARRLRRLVAEDDQPGLVAAAASDGRERAHLELVELAWTEGLGLQVLVLACELERVLGERVRVELVRRQVREVARAVRPLGQQSGALGRV